MKKLTSLLLIITISSSLLAQVQISCDDVEVAKQPLPEVNYVVAIEKHLDGKMEACEPTLRNSDIVATNMHPFVESVHIAYAQHRPLSISPDMIWLLICQGFSKHIDYHGEELRSRLVGFEGKRKIVIATESLSPLFEKGNPNSPWKLAFPAFSDSIKRIAGPKLHNLFIQSFSTTTFMEKAAYEVTLMDGMKSYFEYEMTTSCGIPSITLEGTTEDWLKIKNDLQKFKGYDIDAWIVALEPVIDEFVKTSKNEINHDFWVNIYKSTNGSGGPYITGWLIKFFPYLKVEGNEPKTNPYLADDPSGAFAGLTTADFYSGLSEADFKWIYYNTNYEMAFLAGFIGIKQDKKSMTLRPEIGWIVKDKGSSNIINQGIQYGWIIAAILFGIGGVIIFLRKNRK